MSELRLRLLAHAEARHDYFADGLARRMSFSPTQACQRWLADYELLLRSHGHGLSLHAPEHRLSALWQAVQAHDAQTPCSLDFEVHSGDPAFAWYTEAAEPQTLRLLLPRDPDLAQWLTRLGQGTTLQWHSLRSIWRYWLMGDWDDAGLSIVDTQGSRAFDALGRQPLAPPQGLQAPCFRAQEPQALREHAPQGLQLRAGRPQAATRVLVSQLPAPRPSALQYEIGPHGRQAVSDIFVSR